MFLLVIFIYLFIARSSWSRADIPLEVNDISDDNAVKYLQALDIKENIAKDVVKYLTGGRFSLLNLFVRKSRYTADVDIFECMYNILCKCNFFFIIFYYYLI